MPPSCRCTSGPNLLRSMLTEECGSGRQGVSTTQAGREIRRMRTRFSVFAAGIGLFVATAPVWAHHSFAAEFDEKKKITLRGTVTSMEWVNPHTWIHIDVKNADGTITKWMIEGNTPNSLLRAGFT